MTSLGYSDALYFTHYLLTLFICWAASAILDYSVGFDMMVEFGWRSQMRFLNIACSTMLIGWRLSTTYFTTALSIVNGISFHPILVPSISSLN